MIWDIPVGDIFNTLKHVLLCYTSNSVFTTYPCILAIRSSFRRLCTKLCRFQTWHGVASIQRLQCPDRERCS